MRRRKKERSEKMGRMDRERNRKEKKMEIMSISRRINKSNTFYWF